MNRDYEQYPDDSTGAVLWHMRSKGDLLTEPREIDFSAIFPSEDSALEFAVACLRANFKVEFFETDENQEDGLNWEVWIYTTIVPMHSDITALEEDLGLTAADLGGKINGWSSTFVPSA